MISRRCSSVVMFEQRVEDAEGRWLLLRFLLLRLLLLLLLWIPKRLKMLFYNMPKFLLGFSLIIRYLLNFVKPGPKLSIAWVTAAKRSLLAFKSNVEMRFLEGPDYESNYTMMERQKVMV